MFRLNDCYSYECTPDEIVKKACEVKADTDPILVEQALRYGIANYDKLTYPADNSCTGPKQAISETCRGCEIIIKAEKADRLRSSLLYLFFSGMLRWYAIINSALPILATLGLTFLTKYQSTIFTMTTGISDNGYYSSLKDIVGCSPYVILLAGQAYLVTLFVDWPLGCVYALSVVVTGILALRMSSMPTVDDNVIGWVERLRSDELETILQFYKNEVPTS